MEPWECGHAPGDDPPAPTPAATPVAGCWLTVTEMAERVGLKRSALQRLLGTMADRLIEGEHFTRFHGRVLWHESAALVLQDRPRKIKRSPEETKAINRERARQWRQRNQEAAEERRDAIRQAEAAEALDKLLGILRENS